MDHRTTGSEPGETAYSFFDPPIAPRRGPQGSLELKLYGGIVLWVRAENKVGKWYPEVVEAAERFISRLDVEGARKSSERGAAWIHDAQRQRARERRGVGNQLLKKSRTRWQRR